ncbi:hypothetical protein RFI_27416 [Reticulomyxa filosa]|uniref:Uncharacterized protein n=1 Tax=Reticulomyxa filosa TaxID=46433 RepID=X6M7K5_RETFI|nr:hypothetical protein RFI_27416 [Reticulomyxa filosa]|eukprot:ETO09963.1 hypothetical protein RFI_27416 [Reticulomyxa filosa]
MIFYQLIMIYNIIALYQIRNNQGQKIIKTNKEKNKQNYQLLLFCEKKLLKKTKKSQEIKEMNLVNEKQTSIQITLSEEDTQKIIQHWIRVLEIKLGWIHDFDRLVIDYVMFFAYLFYSM